MNCPHCGHRLPRTGLTELQLRAMKAMLAYRAPNGTCLVSITQVAERIGRKRGPVRKMIGRLVDLGYFEVVSKGSASAGPSRYRPTELLISTLKEYQHALSPDHRLPSPVHAGVRREHGLA